MEASAIAAEKASCRKTLKARLAALTSAECTAAGRAAALHVPEIPRWDSFRSVLLFLSMKDELDTRPLMEKALDAGKLLFAPQVEGPALTFYRIDLNTAGESPGHTKPAANPDLALTPEDFPALVLTPGLAFDRRLNRLGRGRGYYDRFFALLDSAGRDYTPVGLCLDCQFVDEVPAGPDDKRMEAVLTERGYKYGQRDCAYKQKD